MSKKNGLAVVSQWLEVAFHMAFLAAAAYIVVHFGRDVELVASGGLVAAIGFVTFARVFKGRQWLIPLSAVAILALGGTTLFAGDRAVRWVVCIVAALVSSAFLGNLAARFLGRKGGADGCSSHEGGRVALIQRSGIFAVGIVLCAMLVTSFELQPELIVAAALLLTLVPLLLFRSRKSETTSGG